MKKLALSLLLLFGLAALAQAQIAVDPRDSIILESKTVYPGAHPGSGTDTAAWVYLKVYITNKDSLTAVALSLQEKTLSGGAYMILGRPRIWQPSGNSGVVSELTNTLNGGRVFFGGRYHSNSPDSFSLQNVFDPLDPGSIEPPNLIRKALWEIKFDTVFSNVGTIEFDTARTIHGTGFVNTVPVDVRVNIVKSIITVELKGDLNLDGEVRPADVVLELQAVYLGDIPPAGLAACDLNCDGQVTAADITVMLNFKYLASPWPC